MNTDLVTRSRIAFTLDVFEPAVAEHIRTQANESADLALANGWDPAGDAYDLGAMPGDEQALGDRLNRKATREEARGLELCIRPLMAYAAEQANEST